MTEVSRQVETRLAKADVVALEEVGPLLQRSAARGIRFLGQRVRRIDDRLLGAGQRRVQESAKGSVVRAAQSIFIFAIERIDAAKLERMIFMCPGQVAAEIVLPGKVIVVTESGQRSKSVAGDGRHKIACLRIRQRRCNR